MFYLDVLTEFYKEKVRYLIVGGLSVNLHGIPRVTQDIDFILDFDNINISKMNEILSKLDYIPSLPVESKGLTNPEQVNKWINEKNMIALSFHHKTKNYKVIDIIISHNLDFEAAFNNATLKRIDDIEIYIASVDDIIKMKQNTGREQDKSDIEMLKKLKNFTAEKNE